MCTATPLQLCTLAARIASGNAVVPRVTQCRRAAAQPRPPTRRGLTFSDKALADGAGGHEHGDATSPAAPPMRWRITQPGFEMAGKTGTAQVRRITKEERAAGVAQEREAAVEYARPCAVHRLCAGRQAALCRGDRHGAWRATDHPHVQIARDILLFAQQRDPLKLPTAYPVNAAEHRCRRRRMTRDLMPPRGAAFHGEKLLEVNWGLVLLITRHRLHRLCDAVFRRRAAISILGRCRR